MTNPILARFLTLLCWLGVVQSGLGKKSPGSLLIDRIPPESFLVVSLNSKRILQKSDLLQSKVWDPILDDLGSRRPLLKELVEDLEACGLNLGVPLHFFARLEGNSHPTPVGGLLLEIDDSKKADSLLASISATLGLHGKGTGGTRYGKQDTPLEIGRRGKIAYLIGMIPNPRNPPTANFELQIDQLVEEFFRDSDSKTSPDSLRKHLAHSPDASLYLEGTGLSRLLEDFFVQDPIKGFLPAFDPLTHRSLGLLLHSGKGKLNFTLLDYSAKTNPIRPSDRVISKDSAQDLFSFLPDDAPLLGKMSFPSDSFKSSVLKAVDSTMNLLSGGNFDANKSLPGFDASIPDLLDAVSGNFVFAGGDFRIKSPEPPPNPAGFSRFSSSFLIGAEKKDDFALQQLLSGINSSRILLSLMQSNGVRLLETEDTLWITSEDYRREIEARRLLHPLSDVRKEKLNRSAFSLDFDFATFTRTVRKENDLLFEENKQLQMLDQFSNLQLFSRPDGLHGQLQIRDVDSQGLKVALDLMGQKIIDDRNDQIYQAIARNDFEGLAKAVEQGALINANDRFGHTPLHYCAYKGNGRFVDYLLRNGGDPNVRGRHLSTPLHSAAWGRNMEVFELLLEDGAEVDARTDEGETPGMTAALRGEKEMLEILFALSADPHAVDAHGSNMLDLAAAGGHREIVDLLTQIGVARNHPLHLAAGMGDIKGIKSLLAQGFEVNQQDAFGATPLLIAVVSGKMETVNFLLERGADPQINAKDGYTLMHGAAFSGMKEMVRLALSFGLEINPRYGLEGITPVDVAEEQKDALPYLRSLGGRASWELAPIPR